MNKKDMKKRVMIAIRFYCLLILFTLLVTASYTWFTISRTPRVSDMGITISSVTGMELSHRLDDEDGWTQHLNLGETIEDMAPLKPVTWVNSEQRFYAASFGTDGRITGIDKVLSDDVNANRNDADSYYMISSFYARTGTDVNVSLAPATVSNDGIDGSGTYVIGTPMWNGESVIHNNGGNGAEYTVRVGIRITKLDESGNEKADSVQFYVYEPNYDGYSGGIREPVETPSITGDVMLVPEEQMIRQTTSTWTEAYPVQRDVQIKELGEFLTDTHLFELRHDEFARIDLYFWMEGQDIDCNYMIGEDAKILANIQFLAEDKGNSGLEQFR